MYANEAYKILRYQKTYPIVTRKVNWLIDR